ncbi:MAG TPA: ATP-binding protein [Caulobacteraceae bacterium]|nr:ATP-binding protein [Caulobacteraceae bacterium]
MPTLRPAPRSLASESRQAIAVSVQLGRNQLVQTLGVSMVALVGLSVAPWPFVLAWAIAIVATVGAEDLVLRRLAGGRGSAAEARWWAPSLRVLATTIYATAALVLIARGGPGQRLFAFALMSVSMVHVLMRYYRSPAILVASMAPYLGILALVGVGLTRAALAGGHVFAALAPTLTVLIFAVQFWAARAQLSGVWGELMTARLAAEEREQAADAANRAKSQFLATMSHELRTPLNGVLGMAQALTGDRLTAAQRERVGIIRRSSESLLAVLNDLLDLSRIEMSSLELENVEFDLGRLVEGVAATYAPLATGKGIGFRCAVDEEARGRYVGDPARIRRILYGLVDNAVKFTPAGEIRVHVGAGAERVVFEVVDTGIGIGPDDLARLFESFFQVDASLARAYGGAGLGLAVCAELASLMGGKIEVASELGQGARFALALPLARAAEAPPATAAARDLRQSGELRVLAAEDNATNQLVLKTLMGAAGIHPVMVANGREALDAWEAQTWDIILMDIQMPEIDGVEATRLIRRRERESGRAFTPIVAVTANAMTHQLAEYAAAGMDGVVAKPIDLGALLSAMEQALSAGAAAPAGARTA